MQASGFTVKPSRRHGSGSRVQGKGCRDLQVDVVLGRGLHDHERDLDAAGGGGADKLGVEC